VINCSRTLSPGTGHEARYPVSCLPRAPRTGSGERGFLCPVQIEAPAGPKRASLYNFQRNSKVFEKALLSALGKPSAYNLLHAHAAEPSAAHALACLPPKLDMLGG